MRKKEKMNTSDLAKRLQKAWEDNPVAVIAAGAAVLTAGAKIMDAYSSMRSRRAYAKQVDHSVKRGRR